MYERFSVAIYEAPLSEVRKSVSFPNPADPLDVAILIIDLETEVTMNGIRGFIGNRTGRFLPETAAALGVIGRVADAKALEQIHALALAAGMSYETVQADMARMPEYSVATFSQVHGSKWAAALEQIERLADAIDYPGVLEALEAFMQSHRSRLLASLGEHGA